MLVSIEKVNKWFGGGVPVHVLHDVDLSIGQGEMIALVGPSGAGKTTLLNIVATLDDPNSGRVVIRDTDVHRLDQAELNRFRNRHLGFVFQDELLLGHLTALENVMMPARIARRPAGRSRRRAEELLARVGLADRMGHKPGQLSGGQRQRVGIARALINEPWLLLADEPTARLDQATGEGIIELLQEINAQMGVTILMVTHERDIAERTRRIVEFLDGRIVSDRGPGKKVLGFWSE
jgi:ABC-type lipoprotein export system ATPase subunit